MESLQNLNAHTNTVQSQFLSLLPGIERCLRHAFRHLRAEALDEATTEAKASCFVALARLCQTGRHQQAYSSSLARFAARQVNTGRTAGSRLNVHEPLSRYAQQKQSILVERLDRFVVSTREWLEPLVEDRRASIPDQVTLCLDVSAWFRTLSPQTQAITRDLALGCTTGEVARNHKLSAGRISQLRRELFNSWQRFQGLVMQTTEEA